MTENMMKLRDALYDERNTRTMNNSLDDYVVIQRAMARTNEALEAVENDFILLRSNKTELILTDEEFQNFVRIMSGEPKASKLLTDAQNNLKKYFGEECAISPTSVDKWASGQNAPIPPARQSVIKKILMVISTKIFNTKK